jgi:isopropylmalate/homocitrate/citramalate synthase
MDWRARRPSVTVLLCEVGPRDGLQNERDVLPPAVRADLVNRLAAAGLPRVEAVSFVRDDAVPQMAGAEEVVAAIERRDGVEYAGLVLNEKGFERFAATSLDRVNLTLGATETFNRRNANASLLDARERVSKILDGRPMHTTVTISVAFGCPFEGKVDREAVLDLVEWFVELDAGEIVLADTIGVATPRQVQELIREARGIGRPVGFHGHNTRNTGFANAYAALEGGATVLDASVGGLGGCPFAPRATGNIATEDLAYMLEGDGVETGVDLDALIAISEWLEGVLGRTLEGQLYRAGAFPSA